MQLRDFPITLNFNTDWLYHPGDLKGAEMVEIDEKHFSHVNLPHAHTELRHHLFSEEDYRFVSWYRRHFCLDRLMSEEILQQVRIFIDFDGVMTVAWVYLNGVLLAEHKGGYTPFSVDLTDALRNGDNVLAVRVDSTRRPDIPPEGHLVDYMLFGGIYRDVRLRIVTPIHVANVFAWTTSVGADMATVRVTAEIQDARKADKSRPASVHVRFVIENEDGSKEPLAEGTQQLTSLPGETVVVTQEMTVENPRLWSTSDPCLYRVRVEVYESGGAEGGTQWGVEPHDASDRFETRFGIRTAVFSKDGKFYLNGRPLKLRGLNRHQTFPYVGGAMPDRVQRKDADILRFELGVNIVRTSHYPQDPSFLDRCDEIGLLVLEEIPGWQHIGDAAWKELAKDNLRAMIRRDRNHPSIILWGVRINESPDDHDFYLETNALAHELDPSRQTGGVRNFRESEFLEDVFTYNDFSGGVQPANHRPYLVTEFAGHMFPTKSYDNEERLVEHALYHARIQNAQYGMDDVAGAIGWCAFDYNTHVDFGSGDRICYHGVMDIFRLPKYAAYFYQSQLDPAEKVVLFPATRWTHGDRSGGGVDPIVVFSNCEEIDVFVNKKYLMTVRPNREEYGSLPHPPFLIRGVSWPWGEAMQELCLVGKIGGTEVVREILRATGRAEYLSLWADDTKLSADGADATRLVVAVHDAWGQILPYANIPVQFSIKGPGTLVGENPISLEAGRAAVYLRAGRVPGIVSVTASAQRVKPARIAVQVEQMIEMVVPVS